ncbi:MAG TPA: HEAT repeat domain-containing protein [Gemmataceae bacterium]|nr:HEAT repeat domain-containing protein [Gemmataceae bacterium]
MRRWFLLLLVVLVTACRARPPYTGKTVAELEQMLRDPNPSIQVQGAFGLGRLGPEARSAVPALMEALKRDRLVRQHAALALGQIGPAASDAVPALCAALSDPEWAVRRQAALALGQIGPQARPAIPALQKISRDPDPLVREAVQKVLKQIRVAPAAPQ